MVTTFQKCMGRELKGKHYRSKSSAVAGFKSAVRTCKLRTRKSGKR